MKNLFFSLIVLGSFSLNAVYAEPHDTSKDKGTAEVRETNEFPDYDTLATKIKGWGEKIVEEKRKEEKREQSVDKANKKFTVQLSKDESEDAVRLLKSIQWYRSGLVACEISDASAKVLGGVLDECIAPGMLSKAALAAGEKNSRYEVSISSTELISCKTRLEDYYKEKLNSKNTEDLNKFVADREISEKISSLFKLFTPASADLEITEQLDGTLFDSLQKVALENRCEVGNTKVAVETVVGQVQQMPPKPYATKNIKPEKSYVQAQPQVYQEPVVQQVPQQQPYVAPKNEYPAQGYAKSGGYQYTPSYNYDPAKYSYNPSRYKYDNGDGYGGINPYLYMMQPYNKGNNKGNYSHPKQQPYYPQNNHRRNRNFNNNPIPPIGGQVQVSQPPFYPPMMFPAAPPLLPPPIIGGGFTISGGSSGGYVPVIPATTPPCLTGMCQPLPCLSMQCMNRPPMQPGIPGACMPLNATYLSLGVGNFNCNPMYPTNPGYPTNPIYPTNPGYPTNPIYPTNPGYPTNPIYPTNPGYPTNPIYPTNPGYPTNPIYPTNPGYPTNPIYPTNPVYPTNPIQPVIPVNPNLPGSSSYQYQTNPQSPTIYTVPRGVGRR